MKAAVAPTDERWAEFLAERPELTEANFWQPSATGRFRMLQLGEPFLFKTKSPKAGRRFDRWGPNQVVGGGFYSGYDALSIGEAWELFGLGNGVSSLEEFIARIRLFRGGDVDANTLIGCVFLRNLFFMPASGGMPQPEDFASNLTRARGYDLNGAGAHVDVMFNTMLRVGTVRWDDLVAEASTQGDPVEFRRRLTMARLGQRAFKGRVLTSYGRRCAVTGNKVVPVLEAAHIQPVTKGGTHVVPNGLLLRSDVHRLFDHGLLGINERFELQVSSQLRATWGNGNEFYALAGSVIRLPGERRDRPSRESIEWHMDTLFKS
ncbi:MAG TPA: HNH endonuclease [Propionibacterium sp.]|nr:HNH endonuclease [Propionibacterium sp.]